MSDLVVNNKISQFKTFSMTLYVKFMCLHYIFSTIGKLLCFKAQTMSLPSQPVFITSMETDVEKTVVEMTFSPFPSNISCLTSLLVLVLELALNNLKYHLMKL